MANPGEGTNANARGENANAGGGAARVLRGSPSISMMWMDAGNRPSADDWKNWKAQFTLYDRVTIRMEG